MLKPKPLLIFLLSIVFLFLDYEVSTAQKNTFQAFIGGADDELYPCILDAGDNEIILANRTLSHSFGETDVSITKFDSAGIVLWSKQIGDYERNFVKDIYKTEYGYLVVLWRSHAYKIDDWHLIKIDNDGNIIDERFYGNQRDEQFYDCYEIDENTYVIAANTRETTTNATFSIMNNNLDIQSYKSYMLNNSDEVLRSVIKTSTNKILYVGYTYPYYTYLKPFVLSTDESGNIAYCFTLGCPDLTDLWKVIETTDNNFMAVGYSTAFGNGDYDIFLMKINEEGSIVWTKTIGGAGDDKGYDILNKSDGTLLITGETRSESIDNDIFMINIDNDGNYLWGKVYGGPDDEYFGIADLTDQNQVIIAAETESFDTDSRDIYMLRVNDNGNSCCDNMIKSFSIKNVFPQKVMLNPTVYNDYIDATSYDIQNKTIYPYHEFVCYEPLKINGPTGVCAFSNEIRYTIEPKLSHTAFQWSAPIGATIVAENDTSILVNFGEQSGYIYLYSSYCEGHIIDSLFIEVGQLKPDIGNDTVICSDFNMVLYPGYYDEYLWQDGSTDSALVATEHGLYWVEVKNNENCSGTDSILITTGSIEIDLGNDTTICQNSFIELSPGGEFNEYLWSNNSNSSSITVSEKGSYWVWIKNYADCEGFDSITIAVTELPEINLGPDTMVFNGDFVLLDAGIGFDQYLWNDQSNGQTLKAYEPGRYWVTGTKEQCKQSDTIYLKRGKCELVISNIITPNNDGISDAIHVISKKDVSHFSIEIFDLKGVLVFKSYDKNFSWNGTINGSIFPNAIYKYVLTYLCPESYESQIIKGSIVIVR